MENGLLLYKLILRSWYKNLSCSTNQSSMIEVHTTKYLILNEVFPKHFWRRLYGADHRFGIESKVPSLFAKNTIICILGSEMLRLILRSSKNANIKWKRSLIWQDASFLIETVFLKLTFVCFYVHYQCENVYSYVCHVNR